MAFTRVTVTEAEIAFFEGANVAAGGSTADAHEFYVSTAEAYLMDLIQFDIVTNWASLNAKFKLMFSEYFARMAATSAIAYDLSAYTDNIEGENMIKVHWQRALDIENLLLKRDVSDFTVAT